MVAGKRSGEAGAPAADPPRIGVLALQGDFALHIRALERLGVAAVEVRTAEALSGLRGLVLPGGESTSMLKLMERTGLEAAIRAFYENGGALFGTCAGMILLARSVAGPAQRSLGFLDIDIERNAYGRQIDSFETELASVDGSSFRGVFIRAPRVTRAGAGVEVLARVNGDPVLVREGRVLAATFHPELTGETGVHRFFVRDVVGAQGNGNRQNEEAHMG